MKRLNLTILCLFGTLVACLGEDIALHSLNAPQAMVPAQSWGLPFAPGECKADDSFALSDGEGKMYPLQQWTLARWADGSVKWMGFASASLPSEGAVLHPLSKKEAAKLKKEQAGQGIRIERDDHSLSVDNGLFICEFDRNPGASSFIRSLKYGDTEVLRNGRLLLQTSQTDKEGVVGIQRIHPYQTYVETVELEQEGPLRAVVRIQGHHRSQEATDSKLSLPFTLRMYLYYKQIPVKIVHSFVFDGDQNLDFIQGLGLAFDIPMRGEMYNRHVVFAGDAFGESPSQSIWHLGDAETFGIWHEPVQPLTGRRVLRERFSTEQRVQDYPVKHPEDRQKQVIEQELAQKRQTDIRPFTSPVPIYQRQMNFETLPPREAFDASGQMLIDNWAVWNDFKLTQHNADGFIISKRTQNQSPWLQADGGKRSAGWMLAGDVNGGIALGMKDFWQTFPSMLELNGAREDTATLKLWFWSPESEAMDLRHYDVVAHDLNASYEDIQEGLSTPYGIGKTHELCLFPYASIPSPDVQQQWIQLASNPPHTMADPSYYYTKNAFGSGWSLPYAGKEPQAAGDTLCWIEEQLDQVFGFYHDAVEEHHWYGFWNFGDVMHSYDAQRHQWLYDVGGFAWANTELAPEMWLWYSFLRSGRADIFRMAEAMSRHTAEVDAYHIGSLKGLGSRHNVSHWGCGAKEARIAQAAWKRFYYYLTTDERMGDLIHEVADTENTMLEWDPLRIAMPRDRYPSAAPTRLRWGPDWLALAGNWFAEWERTGDARYLNKIQKGFRCLAAMKDGLYAGDGPLGFYPETGELVYEGPEGVTNHKLHLATIMGGFEFLTEMLEAIPDKDFQLAWDRYCYYYSLPEEDSIRFGEPPVKDGGLLFTERRATWGPILSFNTPRLTAYAAKECKEGKLPPAIYQQTRERAWTEFLRGRRNLYYDIYQRPILQDIYGSEELEAPEVLTPRRENPSISTNGTSQWALNAIFMMELLK